ncbi:MAG: ABC transporter permease [Gemmatimonadaceae bacterium]
MNRAALLESARVGADALRANPTRTLLSTTGVVIGVAALVAAFAITDGVFVWSRQLIARESSVQDVVVSPLTSVTIDGRRYAVRGYPVFNEDDAAAASEIPGALRQVLTLSGQSPIEFRDRRATALLTLSTAGLADFSGLIVAAGRFYTAPEVTHRAPVIVLGHRLAEELAGSHDPLWLVGQSIRVRGERREVIGVLATPTGGERDFVAFAPFRGGIGLLEATATPYLPSLRIKSRSIEAVDTLRAATVEWLAQRYGRAVGKLQVVVNTQQLENTRQGILLTKLLLGMLVGLILAVGGIGIMNVLLAAVTERTREIGIRKAVGARARDIKVQFLVESLTVTGAGAALGFIVGLVLAFGGTAIFRHYLGSNIHPVVKLDTALLAVFSAVTVGIVFGTYPAQRAAGLSPVDAIARE